MKKNSMLRFMVVATAMLGSSFVMQAKEKKESQQHENCKSGMKKIEHELEKIMKNFREDHDVAETNDRLDALAPKIEKAVAKMRSGEKHGNMWETHQRTLERKVKDAREEVARYVKKQAKQKKATKKIKAAVSQSAQ